MEKVLAGTAGISAPLETSEISAGPRIDTQEPSSANSLSVLPGLPESTSGPEDPAKPWVANGSTPTLAPILGKTDVAEVEPTGVTRRSSITFKLKNYTAAQGTSQISEPSDLLGPHWAGARLSRASSPALSVQSEASERGSSTKGSGTRPVTFLFTLTTFLRDNPKSPYMRWSEDGTYFIVPDKAGLMQKVIPDLFNQNSYSSFARQLNIYGWRRLQSSPDGKITSSNCTIWKHDQITRDTPDEDLKHVKRNAQDKSRKNSKGMDDDIDDYEVVTRPRRAVTMSSTTAAEAMAARAATGASTNLRYSSTNLETRTRASDSSSTPPRVPSVLAPVPTRPADAASVAALQSSQQTTVSRPLPMRRPPSRSFSYSGRTLKKRTVEAPSELEDSESSDSAETESDEPFVVSSERTRVAPPAPTNARPAKRLRPEVVPQPKGEHVAHRKAASGEQGFLVLPFQVSASRQVMPQNPIDVYIACLENIDGGTPTFKGRDRLDIPIWVDDYSQARFVLAGEVMRAWALWEVVPAQALIYIAIGDGSKPPRPLGIAQQLKENPANGDPNRAFSRERIYLETSSEPGCVGQCCLIFRKSATEEGAGDVMSKSSNRTGVVGSSSAKVTFEAQSWMGQPVPPTPTVQPQAPTSSERRPLLCETRSGRKLSDRFLDSPALPSPAMRTPKTADAISSLAAMQALARSFTPSRELDVKSPVLTLASADPSMPRSVTMTEDVEMKPVLSGETRMTPVHAGGTS